MQTLTNSKLIEALNWRYATKKFDSTKKIDEKTWSTVEDALILTPSSYGLQPWKFVVVTDKAVMQKLTASSWGQKQVEDCSHLVVIAVKEKIDADYVNHYVNTIVEQRGVNPLELDGLKKMMMSDIVNGPRSEVSFEWAARQAYIALGNLLTVSAVLGLDTCPMEGILPAKYDEILGLTGSGFKTVVACPVGFRAADDKYAQVKKIRFSNSEIIKKI
jgi:nitroreductase